MIFHQNLDMFSFAHPWALLVSTCVSFHQQRVFWVHISKAMLSFQAKNPINFFFVWLKRGGNGDDDDDCVPIFLFFTPTEWNISKFLNHITIIAKRIATEYEIPKDVEQAMRKREIDVITSLLLSSSCTFFISCVYIFFVVVMGNCTIFFIIFSFFFEKCFEPHFDGNFFFLPCKEEKEI